MTGDAAFAYDDAARVARYNADMDVMHPNRAHMARIVGEWLPLDPEKEARIADLGVGTGYLALRLLERFPLARLAAVDSAEEMLKLARARLAAHAGRVAFVRADFRRPDEVFASEPPLDAVVSSFALHHLAPAEKLALLEAARRALRPGAWFVNADILAPEGRAVDDRVQFLRVGGIVERSAGRDDPRFRDAASTRAAIAEVERRDGDQPLTLRGDLDLLARAGFTDVAPLWLEYRETVTAGRVPERGA